MTPAQEQKLAEFKSIIETDSSASSVAGFLSAYIQASEYELILFMKAQNVWQGAFPPPPPSFKPGDGSIEFGLFLYWFKNPSQIASPEIALIAIVMDAALGLPGSLMTLPNYNYFKSDELVYTDGSILGMKPYATFDQGWFAAFINLLETFIRKLWYNNGVFPMPVPPPPIPLKGASPDRVTIALVGDWGTGDAAAAAVMRQIVSLKPDYIIHLGDVYYGGTPTAQDPNAGHYYSLNEEVNNFIKCWPAGYAGKSFALNSNHEMYSGANGYFYDALLAAGTPFSAQNKMSCFALQYAGWTILGLDSAFYGTSLDAFMQGFIGDAGSSQVQWINKIKPNPAQTIVLTHHTGFDYDAGSVNPLWAQVKAALGGADPYAWYWGHAHNGIVYTNPVKIAPGFATNTYARCAGHGALPYGVSTALQNNDNVVWQASSPQPAPSKQVFNGFVMLTLAASNNLLTSITEAYYDPSSANPTWSKVIYNSK